jgi:hypothetical protein
MSLPLGSLEVVVSTLRIDPLRVSTVDAISNWIRGTLQVSEDSESVFCNGVDRKGSADGSGPTTLLFSFRRRADNA